MSPLNSSEYGMQTQQVFSSIEAIQLSAMPVRLRGNEPGQSGLIIRYILTIVNVCIPVVNSFDVFTRPVQSGIPLMPLSKQGTYL